MKNTQQTRRELFEKAFAHMDLTKVDGEYSWKIVDSRWEGFNAALDAIEIKLSSVYDFHSTSGMKRGCKESIESLNLGIKVK